MDALALEFEQRQDYEQAWLMAKNAGLARQQVQQQKAERRAEALASKLESERTRAERMRLEDQAAQAHEQAELLQAEQNMVEQLGRIGREITEQLELDTAFTRIYEPIRALVDAPHLSIWLLDEAGESLQLRFGVEEGRPMAAASVGLDDAQSNLVHCWKDRSEVLHISDVSNVDPFHLPGTVRMLTGLFGPLIVRDKTLGVMTIQSWRADAYGERERLVFRAVCSYGAIALDNAAVCASLDRARRSLQASSQGERLARQHAEQAKRMKSQFLADMSGALQAPLESLQRSLSLMKEQMPRAHALAERECLQLALQHSHAANLIARELLELARLESGAVEPMPETFCLAELAHDVLLKAQAVAAQGGRRFQIHFEPQDRAVLADIWMIERALTTFIVFALRRTPVGGAVQLYLQPTRDGMRLRIEDSGPRLTAAARRKLFNRPTGPPSGGDGLGEGDGLSLAIARQMLLLNGSELRIVDRDTAGAEVQFTLRSPP